MAVRTAQNQVICARSIEQITKLYLQSRRQLFNDGDRRIAGPALEIADIGAMYFSAERKFLLRPALVLAQTAKIEGKALTNNHLRTVASMSTIDLQTISDNRLDLLASRSVSACH